MSRVALENTFQRRSGVLSALRRVRETILPRIASPVLIKPNFLSSGNQYASTHADAVRGVLDFLTQELPKPPQEVWIAEGGNERYSGEAFRNFGYERLPEEYPFPIRLIDLHQETEWEEASIELADGSRTTVGVPKTVLRSPCRISVAVAKTHDVLYTTLALKNMIMGTIRKEDRVKMHGFPSHPERQRPRECQVLNRNLIRLSRWLTPEIAVIDGVVGLEGDGPGGRDIVPFGAVFAGADVWAVDAVCTAAMGFDPRQLGVFLYAERLGLGVTDLERIQVLGAPIEAVRRQFRPHRWYEHQRRWEEPEAVEPFFQEVQTLMRAS
ncbi:MAG: hypothetical protein KatS3mg115_2183 [Candidatus Poribacteria bacterium]|nr:MAG: hypothetical protein KatS3mg115_2183 [Candidatus Poribacteria bacterium]